MDIDETNATILRTLLLDSRTSLTEIAKICGITPAAVRMRVLRLKEAEVIKREITIVNPHSIGYKCVVNIGIKTAVENEKEVTEFLKNKFGETAIFGFLPKYNVFVVVLMNNMQELAAIIEDLEAHPKVKRVETMIWAEAAYLEHVENLRIGPKLNLMKSDEGRIRRPNVVSVEEVEMDETDRQIARILTNHSRISFNGIADQLKISTKNVIQRYRRLKGTVLTHFTVSLDLTKLGYTAFAFIFIKVANRGRMSEIYSQLLQIPNMAVAFRMLGAYDLNATLFVKNFDELFDATERMRRITGIDAIDTYLTPVWPEWPPNLFGQLL